MKKSVISFCVAITLLLHSFGFSAFAANTEDESLRQMIRDAICSEAEFLREIVESSQNDELKKYTDGIEIPSGDSFELFGISAEPSAIMHNGIPYVPLEETADSLGYETQWNNGNPYIEHNGVKTRISTDETPEDGEIPGVVMDEKTFVAAADIADICDLRIVLGQDEAIKFIDKFQTKRLFAKIKDIGSIYDNSILRAFSEAEDIAIQSDGLIFAEFATEDDAETAYDLLHSSNLMEFTEPDNLVALTFDSTYTWGTQLCNLNNFIETYPDFIRGENEVTVAVIDSGLNTDDPIFDGRVVYDSTMPSCEDTIGHGTHVAGIIAAFTEATGTNIKICPYKIQVEDDGTIPYTTVSEMYSVVSKASAHDIINMSLAINLLSYYPTLVSALDRSTDSLFVVSAGNDQSQVYEDSLAAYMSGKPNGIAVTAVDINGNPAYFSNYTTSANTDSYIAAPGVDICSPVYVNGQAYGYKSGTSQAAPHVAAACALVAHASKTSWTPAVLKNTIFSRYCHTPDGWNNIYGKGILYFDIETEGSFGNGFKWKYIAGELSITGEGEFPEFTNPHFIPWKHLAEKITSVSVEGNITGFTIEKLGDTVNLKSISVSEENPELKTVSGALYTKDGKTLVRYPQSGNCAEYVVPHGTSVIGKNAFSGCKDVTSMVIPTTVETIETDAFLGCTSISDIYYEGTQEQWNSIDKYDGWDSQLGTESYNKAYLLTLNYISPDYMGKCGETAVWKLWTDKGLLSIEGKGEMYDFELTEANGAITGNTAGWSPYKSFVKKLEIRNGITVIGKNAFNMCVSFTDASLGDSVTAIRTGAFDYTLKTLTLSKDFAGLEGASLGKCLGLTNIYVHEENERYISVDGVVYTKDKKELIAYPPGRTDDTFTLPEGVKKIGNDAFNGNYYVETINFCEGLEQIGDRAFMSSALTFDITFPRGLKKIGTSAFEGCHIMVTALPEGFESLGDRAFASCTALRYITLPISTKKIGSRIFEGSYAMTTVYFAGTQAQWNAIDRASDWNYMQSHINVVYERALPSTEHDVSGSLGNGVTWNYWEDEQFLLIKGKGAITETDTLESYKDNIKTIYIEDGITEISYAAFYYFKNLSSVTLPDTLVTVSESAFAGCSSLESVIIPDSVTTIAQWAFANCSSLTSLKLPAGLKTITYESFSGCFSLETLTIPDSVTTIENGAFMGLTSLKSISVPDGVTTIMRSTFESCSSLEEVHLPDTIKQIDEHAFKNCTALKSLALPKNLESVLNSSFYGSGISNFSIHPESTKLSVSDGVLYNYDKTELLIYPASKEQTTFEVPSSVTKLSAYSFYYAQNLERIVIPSSVTEIPDYVFYEAKKLTEIDAPSVKYVGQYAFFGCESLESISSMQLIEEVDRCAFDNCYALSDTGELKNLKNIRSYAFYNCRSLKSITIHENIELIENSAFYGCKSVEYILVYPGERKIDYMAFSSMPAVQFILHTGTDEEWQNAINLHNVTVIHSFNTDTKTASGICGENASWTLYPFSNLLEISGTGDMTDYASASAVPWYSYRNVIKTVNIKDGITSVGSYSFCNHSAIEEINLRTGIQKIGNYCFYKCTSVKNFDIPQSAETIGNYAFYHCIGETEFVIPDSVKSIGNYAFKECDGMAAITLGNGLEAIGNNAFDNCSALKSVQLPESLKTIGNTVFSYCPALTSVVFLSAPEAMGTGLFYYCSGLKTVEFRGGVSQIPENTFYNCTSLTKVVLNEGAKFIGTSAFENCTQLLDITLPDSLEEIGNRAFYGCTVVNLSKLPAELRIVGDSAFYNCKAIKTIIIDTKIEKLGSNSFYYSGRAYKVYYKGTITQWKAVSMSSSLFSTSNVFCYFDGVNYPDYSGSVGSYEYWQIDKDSGVLILVGKGTMSSSLISAYSKYKSYAKTVIIEEGITSIPYNALQSMSSLESITLPKGVTSLEAGGFKNCYNLIRADLGNISVTSIPNDLFYGCSKLEEVVLPTGVKSVGSQAFAGCTSLKEINLGQTEITNISNNAFKSCSNLVSLTLPANLKTIGESAFESCSKLSSVQLPSSVTSMGESAFSSCNLLETAELSPNLEAIAAETFRGCGRLSAITIPDGVKSIESMAFDYCLNLQTVIIPKSVESIKNNAFGYKDYGECSKATVYYYGTREQWATITGGEDITVSNIKFNYNPNGGGSNGSCGDSVFWNFDEQTGVLTLTGSGSMTDWSATDPEAIPWYEHSAKITEVVIATDVTDIGNNAFSSCMAIKKITVEDGNSTYYTDDNSIIYKKTPYELVYYPVFNTATSYKVPEGVTSISSGAFKGNSALTEVFLPDGLTTVEDSTFSDCVNLTLVFIPKTVTTIKSHAFNNCPLLPKVHYEGSISDWNKISTASNWSDTAKSLYYYTNADEIFDNYGTYDNMVWHYYASSKTLKIFTEGDLPDLSDSPPGYPWSNIKSYAENAEIIGPTTRIGKNCFYNLSNLRQVTLPETVTLIGDYAFSGCRSLTQINIPKAVTVIGQRAFRDCYSLETVDIPDSVQTLGESVFYNCKALKSVTLGTGISTIPSYAFESCISLAEFTVPANVTKISSSAFAGCTGLQTFIIPKTVTSIGNGFVPASSANLTVYYEGTQSAFRSMFSLTSSHKFKVVYNYNSDPNIVSGTCGTQAEWILNKKTGILELSGKGAVYSSSTSWQEHTASIKSVVVSNNITEIGANLFANCTVLEEITIPDTVKKIGSGAFLNCHELSVINYPGPKVNWNAIYKDSGWNSEMGKNVSGGTEVICSKSDSEYTEKDVNIDKTDIKELYIYTRPTGYLDVDLMSLNWNYEGYVIVAFYNGDDLIDVEMSFALSSNTRYKIPQNATRAKAMWIKGFQTMRPLCIAAEDDLQ